MKGRLWYQETNRRFVSRFARFEEMIVTGKSSDQNMLKPDVLDYIYDLHMGVLKLEVGVGLVFLCGYLSLHMSDGSVVGRS